MPGVAAFLERGSKETNLLIGLATGNLEPAAWLKLKRGGIQQYFQFGGFGSDSHDRTELTRIAVKRGREIASGTIPCEHIYVIGDTPYDIRAAKALGLKTIAVATGIHKRAELLAHAPTRCLSNLTDESGILHYITKPSYSKTLP